MDRNKQELSKTIIDRELDREIKMKQKEVVEISERIEEVMKKIGMLRYVAACGLYDSNPCLKDPLTTQGNSKEIGMKMQTQLHPAIKPLLMGNMTAGQVEMKQEPIFSVSVDVAVPLAVPQPQLCEPPIQKNTRRGAREKYRFIVGNISKWLHPDTREDMATHKWMVYVRDTDVHRDVPITNLIQKVRYFLHESFKPHDIVDVTSAPFSLTRRGWGEFPVRVQLHFRNSLNKPVDIVHNLKLDMTKSGVQMLGAETVVDVYLHSSLNVDCVVLDNTENVADSVNIKEEQVTVEIPSHEEYLNPENERIQLIIAADHDYCIVSSISSASSRPGMTQDIGLCGSRGNEPSQGFPSDKLGICELDNFLFIGRHQSKYSLTASRQMYMRSFIERIHVLNLNRVESLLHWLHQQWPIITKRSEDLTYQCIHPYSCPSLDIFERFNIGKQRSAEWFRSKAVQNVLMAVRSVFDEEVWSTRQIMVWSRHHGYTPLVSWQGGSDKAKNKGSYLWTEEHERPVSSETCSSLTTYECATRFGLDTLRGLNLVDEDVDVVGELASEADLREKKSQTCEVVAKEHRLGKLVSMAAQQLGIRFPPEEVLPGVTCNAALHVTAQAVQSFLEEIIRRSLARSWQRQGQFSSCTIPVVWAEDVARVLLEDPKFDIFTNKGLGVVQDETCRLTMNSLSGVHETLERSTGDVSVAAAPSASLVRGLQRLRHQLQCSPIFRNVYYGRHRAWRFLHLARDEDRTIRLRAVRALAQLDNLTASDYQQLAQACDMRTAIGLVRSEGASLYFLLDPPYFKLRPDKKAIMRHLHEFLVALDSQARHKCLQRFLSDSQEDKLFDDDPTSRSSYSSHIPLCLEQMLHHSSVGHNAKYIPGLGGLPLLTEVYKYLVQQEDQRGCADSLVMLARLISNITVFEECHQALFMSGWVKLLAVLSKHQDVRVSAAAARALTNLDRDYEGVIYYRRVYPLYPVKRRLRKPSLDVVFIHGLLGGVFVTWRQQDLQLQRHQSPLELLGFLAEDKTQGDAFGFDCEVDKEDLDDFEVVLSDVPVDSNTQVPASGPYYMTRGCGTDTKGRSDRARSKCWPRDWLARDCPDIRIIGINYETNLSMWSPMCPAIPGRRELVERSTSLMRALTSAGVGQRPVVWVAHSMGGLLVKDMLVKARRSQVPEDKKLYENTKGIVFYSTPHKGSNLAVLNATSQMILWPSVEVQELRRNSPHLISLHDEFLDLVKSHPIRVLSFAERKSTYITSVKFELRFVDDTSSEADVGELYGIPLDHLSICKPFSRQSFLYQKVVDFISDILSQDT